MTIKEVLTLCPYLKTLRQQVLKGEGTYGQRLDNAKQTLKSLVGWNAGLPYEHLLNNHEAYNLAYGYIQGVIHVTT